MTIKKVILVEDDPDDRDLFDDFFSKRNDVELLPPVTNGVELIDYLETISHEDKLPDLIVLDQNMPKMNGKQTLKILKTSKRFSRITAVVYSTYADSSLIVECMKLGANMVASKPIDDDGYQKMMDDFLQLLETNQKATIG